jgi:hypothetical protein
LAHAQGNGLCDGHLIGQERVRTLANS